MGGLLHLLTNWEPILQVGRFLGQEGFGEGFFRTLVTYTCGNLWGVSRYFFSDFLVIF